MLITVKPLIDKIPSRSLELLQRKTQKSFVLYSSARNSRKLLGLAGSTLPSHNHASKRNLSACLAGPSAYESLGRRSRLVFFYYRRSDILSAVCVRVCYRQQQLAMVYSTTPGLSGKPKCLIQHRTSCSVMCRHDFNEHPCENTVEDRTCPADLKTSQTRGSPHDCQPCQRDIATPALQSSTICCW